VGKRQYSRVLMKVGQSRFDLLRVMVMPDTSVVIQVPYSCHSQVEVAFDGDAGEVRPPTIAAPKTLELPKITFHASGQYKISSHMGWLPVSLDRATVVGPRLAEITAPRRMLEILLPEALPLGNKYSEEMDLCLDASSAPHVPLRLTVSCMSRDECERIAPTNPRWVDTSVWETWATVANENQAWVFTLRASEDTAYYPRLGFFVPGDIKWGA